MIGDNHLGKQTRGLLLTGVLALAWLILACSGCGSVSAPADTGGEEDVFSIYLVAGGTTGETSPDLGSLKLQEQPWLSIDDVAYYDFSSHDIYLKTDKSSLFGDDPQGAKLSTFVVVAAGERCYLGYFHSPLMSWLPQAPVISSYPGLDLYPEDVIHIDAYLLSGAVDPRADPRIRGALERAGKLRNGVSVALSDVSVTSDNSLTRVGYTLTITNNDDAPLYVPDPGAMGAGLFDYFSGGLAVSGGDGYSVVLSGYDASLAPQPHDSWDASWFTRLDGHETMQRTLSFDCGEAVSPGLYSAYVRYSGPSRIEKAERAMADGWIWVGTVASNGVTLVAGG